MTGVTVIDFGMALVQGCYDCGETVTDFVMALVQAW